MGVVVKLGGTNGSGKTTFARALIEHLGMLPVTGSKKHFAYIAPKQCENHTVALLGSYENVCGGMDTISDKEDRLALIKEFAIPSYITIFEGLITGKTYGAIGALSEQPDQFGKWIYAFMDTPYETCVERVYARRQAKGNLNPFEPSRTMLPTFRSCAATRLKAAAMGHEVYMVNHAAPPLEEAERLISFIARKLGRRY